MFVTMSWVARTNVKMDGETNFTRPSFDFHVYYGT